MKSEGSMDNFCITCLGCTKANRNHNTHIHINWERMRWMVYCKTCSVVEVYDEMGIRIDPEAEAKLDEPEKDKLLN